MAITEHSALTGFRPASVQDSRQLEEIAREAYGKYLGLVDEPPAPLLLDYREVAASGRTHVAVSDDGVIGMVTVEPDDPYVILRNLAVHPVCQGQGIGKKLVVFVEEMARSAGLKGVRLWTRAEMVENISFYRRLGYVITHAERNEHAHRVFLCKESSSRRD